MRGGVFPMILFRKTLGRPQKVVGLRKSQKDVRGKWILTEGRQEELRTSSLGRKLERTSVGWKLGKTSILLQSWDVLWSSSVGRKLEKTSIGKNLKRRQQEIKISQTGLSLIVPASFKQIQWCHPHPHYHHHSMVQAHRMLLEPTAVEKMFYCGLIRYNPPVLFFFSYPIRWQNIGKILLKSNIFVIWRVCVTVLWVYCQFVSTLYQYAIHYSVILLSVNCQLGYTL